MNIFSFNFNLLSKYLIIFVVATLKVNLSNLKSKSGDNGFSYGESIPVKSVISPEKAFLYKPLTSRFLHISKGVLI